MQEGKVMTMRPGGDFALFEAGFRKQGAALDKSATTSVEYVAARRAMQRIDTRSPTLTRAASISTSTPVEVELSSLRPAHLRRAVYVPHS